MAKGFKHGAGGGVGLNFKVICNPKPETAKENTIWVDTDVKITGWHFCFTEPTEPTEGVVWFPTSSSGPIEFDALKKNSIHVRPLSAKQYIGGAWVDKTAEIYQNGEWVDWIFYLYDSGDEFESLTGGWSSKGMLASSDSSGSTLAPTITRNDFSMTIAITTDKRHGIGYVNNPIDLTGYSTLTVEGSFDIGGSSVLCVWNGKELPSAYKSYVAGKTITSDMTSVEIDVSALSGYHRIGFGMNTNFTNSVDVIITMTKCCLT